MTTPNNTRHTVIRPIEPPAGTVLLGHVAMPAPLPIVVCDGVAARYAATVAAIQDGGAVH